MDNADIVEKLNSFHQEIIVQRENLHKFCRESPFDRAKREIKKIISIDEKYRISVMKNVNTFSHLSAEALSAAAQCLDVVFYKCGDNIILQDDIGDCFYIIEEGSVRVTRKQNSRDNQEIPKELAILGKNSYFGEISLITEEPRSATVTVISDTAKCLRMTKVKFNELVVRTNKFIEKSRAIIGRDVLEMVPLFKTLTSSHKERLLEAMSPSSFLPNTYICRQGTVGNNFYIITDGTCRVTINTDEKKEIEVAKLSAGDFFGEIALIELSNKRTANVIAAEPVSCLTLSRTDFNRLLKNLKVKLMEHQVMKRMIGTGNKSKDDKSMELLNKRRISGFNLQGHRDEPRIANIMKRFSKYLVEALWNSLYSRMYRQMLLDESKTLSYGDLATQIMSQHIARSDAVESIRSHAVRILEMDPSKRSTNDHAFVIGLFNQKNDFKDKLCSTWPSYEFTNLCRKVRMVRIKAMRKIIEADTRGSSAFVIIRGAVRIFHKTVTNETAKMQYEEDLFPGEMFGESALGGTHTRTITAVAITAAELLTIEDSDYTAAQDRSKSTISIEDRYQFLMRVSIFKQYEPYKLYRLGHALRQEEICKGVRIIRRGFENNCLYFLLHGRLDLVYGQTVITTLQVNEYFGETGFLNSRMRKRPIKYQQQQTSQRQQPQYHHHHHHHQQHQQHRQVEEFDIIAMTTVDLLVLPPESYEGLDASTYDIMLNAYRTKCDWRKQRCRSILMERERLHERNALLREEAGILAGQKQFDPPKQLIEKPSSPLPPLFKQTVLDDSVKSVFYPSYDHNDPLTPSSGTPRLEIESKYNIPKPLEQVNPWAAISHLDDIEDIPVLLLSGYDPIMIAPTCPTARKLELMQDQINRLRVPKAARVREWSAKLYEEDGFSKTVQHHPEVAVSLRDSSDSVCSNKTDNQRNSDSRHRRERSNSIASTESTVTMDTAFSGASILTTEFQGISPLLSRGRSRTYSPPRSQPQHHQRQSTNSSPMAAIPSTALPAISTSYSISRPTTTMLDSPSLDNQLSMISAIDQMSRRLSTSSSLRSVESKTSKYHVTITNQKLANQKGILAKRVDNSKPSD